MHVFASSYVVALHVDPSGITIQTAELLAPTRRITRANIRSVDYREGRSTPGMVHSVHAPWVKIRVTGYRLPFIVDMQSDYIDEAALKTLPQNAAQRGM